MNDLTGSHTYRDNLQFRHLADANPERLTVGISTGKYNLEHFYTYHLVELTIDYTVYN